MEAFGKMGEIDLNFRKFFYFGSNLPKKVPKSIQITTRKYSG